MLLCVTKKMLQFALIVIEQEFLFKCNPMVHSINCDVEGSIGNIQNIYCLKVNRVMICQMQYVAPFKRGISMPLIGDSVVCSLSFFLPYNLSSS